MTSEPVRSVRTKTSAFRIPDSIFLRCLAILAVSSAITISVLTYRSVQTMNVLTTNSMLELGSEVTKQLSLRTSGALRFRKSDEIETKLVETLDNFADKTSGALVIDSDGNIVVEETRDRYSASDALEVAQQTLSSGSKTYNAPRMIVAQPIFFGESGELIGVVALDWNSEVITAQIRAEKRQSILLTVALSVIVMIVAGFLIRRAVSKPLHEIAEAMKNVQEGNFDIDIPKYRRGNEIGIVARGLESFRNQLQASEETRKDALMKSTALDSGSAAIMIADADFKIVYASSSVLELLTTHASTIQSRIPTFDPDNVVGQKIDIFHNKPDMQRGMLSKLDASGHEASLEMDDVTLDLKISKIDNETGERVGYVVEWADASETRLNAAVLESLDQNQARAEFDANGNLIDANASFRKLAMISDNASTVSFNETVMMNEAPVSPNEAMFGELEIYAGDGTKSHALGGLSPVFYQNGDLKRTVLIAADVTEEVRQKLKATADREQLQQEQAAMIEALTQALGRLSDGDLTFRIENAFAGANDRLRQDFNDAMNRLEEAIASVVVSATTIDTEVSGVAGAAAEMSKRTENQAATLEETAAAITQITASVSSSAESAKSANDLATAARSNAANSEKVVQDAVTSMGEISESSAAIASIVKVIDDIAFQTNLLALNAGVEAARAGDAGRGFAVVASEVRTLAQRSADAATEIGNLISASSATVEKGVELVGTAGEALEQIIGSVSEISDNVSAIASAAQEQSMSIGEVNTAMGELDKVTQENAAMFEETTAATQSLSELANGLSASVGQFSTKSAKAEVSKAAKEPEPQPYQRQKVAAVAGSRPVLDDGWQDF